MTDETKEKEDRCRRRYMRIDPILADSMDDALDQVGEDDSARKVVLTFASANSVAFEGNQWFKKGKATQEGGFERGKKTAEDAETRREKWREILSEIRRKNPNLKNKSEIARRIAKRTGDGFEAIRGMLKKETW